MTQELITALSDPNNYPHPVAEIRVIETHISWVILTGEIAYKIKKPVNFGFLDFTSLESRKHYCYEELRLNQRLAPDIYQEVVAICGTPASPTLIPPELTIPEPASALTDMDATNSASTVPESAAAAKPFEYAVKMRQFDDSLRLDRLLQKSALTTAHIDALSQQIADFHLRVPHASTDGPWGESETIWQVVSDNFAHTGEHLEALDDWMELQQLAYQISQQFRGLSSKIIQRKREGNIRECHGDLHLANTTLLNNQVRLFDCIEFNLEFRWIDTICDLAFLLMDLEANQQQSFSHRSLNRYLEITGDYDGTQLLNFYKGYRAMVRAKVAVIGAVCNLQEYRRYIKLALSYANKPSPVLFLMHGVSGSGKSYLSQQLLERSGAIRIRSDVERKRLHREFSLKGENLELYGHEMNVHTYNHLKALTEKLLRVGESVIVDATFIRIRTRKNYLKMATKLGVELRIVACRCDQQLMQQRLDARKKEGADASDADVTIMLKQLESKQQLEDDELAYSYRVDTGADQSINALCQQIRQDPLISLPLID
ncbi:bifunctional aminoglycoside phosphotransferase/ATP-binding protein [uncultured Amphritea sp.]|uniref:bifunctional aminoglycoside phosphotransferase/ATP-binding protein n=1 Tax=uncultured Amphritea sp. TaxID=981605 RepID=UPI0026309917|nr:bifunctional aminoglycoside phosphotransferase/ATP-binding protein [uncultured Amphritea sp.]